MKVIIFAIISFVNFQSIHGVCNTCDTTTNFACFSRTQYMPCSSANGIDVSAIATCPGGGICSNTIAMLPCAAAGANPSCNSAPVTLATTTAAPTTTTTTTPTTTTTTPTTTTMTPTIRTRTRTTTTTTTTTTPTTTTWTPTTTTMASTTTTPAFATFNPANWCANRVSGRFPHPSLTTCTTYVQCFLNGGVMTGWVYTCLGTTFFNPARGICDSNYSC